MKYRRTVVYMRYSSTMQDDGFSIEYQRSETRECAEKNGLVIDGEYIDEAKTGTKVAGRDGFYNLIRAVKNGEISSIIIYKMSRMFRNTKESEYYRDLFRKFDVKLFSATEYINEDTSSGRMTTSILSVIDQYQSEITSDQVRSSMREMARQGFFTGGLPPFGYTTEAFQHGTKTRKRYAPNPEEAEILHKAFELYANGYSINGVCDELNKQGFRTRKGKRFCHQTMIAYLKNETYIGRLKYKAKGYDEVICDDAHPAIISETVFNVVQQRLKNRAFNTTPRKRKHFYALTGKIKCECGSNYVGVSLTRFDKNPDYRYNYVTYKCHEKHVYKNCNNKQVYKAHIEEDVLQLIKTHILNEASITAIAENVASIYKTQPQPSTDKLKQLKNRADFLNNEIDLIIEMRRNKELSSDRSAKRIAPLEEELNELEKAINNFSIQSKSAITPESVKAYLSDMLKRSENCDDETLKVIFDNFVEEIIIYRETVDVRLRVLPDLSFIHNGNTAVTLFNLCINTKRRKNTHK